MRTLIALLLAAFTVVAGTAAPRYRVFKVRGDVAIEDSIGRHAARIREQVNANTVFHIAAGASVALLDGRTKSVYYSTSKGRATTLGIIREARKKADATTAAIGTGVMSAINGERRASAPKGVAHRGDDVVPSAADDAVVAAVRAAAGAGSLNVRLEVVADADSVWYPVVVNNSGGPVYVNIVDSNEQPRQLMLSVGYSSSTPCVLVGEGRTELPHYSFFGTPPASLAVVACEEPFDVPAVNLLLKRGAETAAPAGAPAITFSVL